MRHTAGWILGVAALALASAGARADLLEDAKESGKVTVGIANEAPYGYQTPEGELTGEAPEIAKYILGEMGIEDVEAVITEFGSLIPGLKAGRFDMVAAGMFVTPERCKQVDFSEPTYGIGQAFLVADGNPEGLQTYEDIKENSDSTLAVMAGAIERTYARDAGVPDDQVMVVPDTAAGTAAVQAGRADAFALTSLSIRRLAEGAEGVEQAPVLDEAVGGEPEEKGVDGEVPPRRVVDRFPIGVPGGGSGRRRAAARAGARVGDVDVLPPPGDRDPVDREMPARRHDLSNPRHRRGERSQDLPGPPVRKARDQQVRVPRLPSLDEVAEVPPDEVHRPAGGRDRPGEVPEQTAKGGATEQCTAQCFLHPIDPV